jgi:coenzyme PQQ precursor peptide PqqA
MKKQRQRWQSPEFEERQLGAEVTAYVRAAARRRSNLMRFQP